MKTTTTDKLKKEEFFFVKQLLKWNNETNDRQMPWKGEKDPYKIWLSEIILQQTRVDQGLAYYNRFIEAFPNIHQLAAAPENQVFKLWEGLGYYTRCKNLIASARYISDELKGEFPHTYESIIALKGVGPYTAAAIASFAFNLPHAVVDGNVYRVLSRYFGIEIPIDSTKGKSYYQALANKLLPHKTPGIYNQALMDFGAVICKPQLPVCSICPVNRHCVALSTKKINALPVKEKFITKKTRWFYYFVVQFNGMIYVKKRGVKDIWENLYEFVLVENEPALNAGELLKLPVLKQLFGNQNIVVKAISPVYKQQLTHQTIYGRFLQINVAKAPALKDFETIAPERLNKLPFPKFITQYLRDKNVSLNLF